MYRICAVKCSCHDEDQMKHASDDFLQRCAWRNRNLVTIAEIPTHKSQSIIQTWYIPTGIGSPKFHRDDVAPWSSLTKIIEELYDDLNGFRQFPPFVVRHDAWAKDEDGPMSQWWRQILQLAPTAVDPEDAVEHFAALKSNSLQTTSSCESHNVTLEFESPIYAVSTDHVRL